MYRIRSTINAFIKLRERYASGNERAMGARCVHTSGVAILLALLHANPSFLLIHMWISGLYKKYKNIYRTYSWK